MVLKMTYIMGKNTINEILKHKKDKLIKVFCLNLKDPLAQSLKDGNIEITQVNKSTLFSMVNSESHQGFIAKIKPRIYKDLNTFLKEDKDSSFVLMLDNIYDPQNLGSILRSAECFSVDAVVFSKNRGSDVTSVVSKASSGASELVEIIKVSNLQDSIRKFKKADYEIIIADFSKEAKNLYTYEFGEKTLLVMGSEGRGIQPIIKKLSDVAIYIPLYGEIASLNVSQATAIILSQFKSRAS